MFHFISSYHFSLSLLLPMTPGSWTGAGDMAIIIIILIFLIFILMILPRDLYVTSLSLGWMCWVITTPTPVNLFQQIYMVRNEVILFLSWFIFSEAIPEYCSIAGVETINNCKMKNQMLNGSDCLGEALQDVGQNSKLFNRCLCHGYLENYAAMWTIWRMMCEQPILPTLANTWRVKW